MRQPFVHSHNLSCHDLLLEQSSVQLVKAVPQRQHRGHKEMIHGLYKLYRWMRNRCTNSCCPQPEPNHAWASQCLFYGKQCLGAPAGPGDQQGQILHCLVLDQSYTHTQCLCARCPGMCKSVEKAFVIVLAWLNPATADHIRRCHCSPLGHIQLYSLYFVHKNHKCHIHKRFDFQKKIL